MHPSATAGHQVSIAGAAEQRKRYGIVVKGLQDLSHLGRHRDARVAGQPFGWDVLQRKLVGAAFDRPMSIINIQKHEARVFLFFFLLFFCGG